MKLWQAILLTLGIYIGCIYFFIITGHHLLWYIIPATSLWAAIDSSQIQLKRYRYGAGPFVFFFLLCCGCWVVGFPWYLWMRYKIKNGTAELKTDALRCVRCEELIEPGTKICPKCGWTQPKLDTRNES
jgi:hypothetical protein